jgi:DNA-binding CsgD family transcriptional regulator
LSTTNWNEAVPDIISLIGLDPFAPRLDAALNALAPFDLSCCFAYPSGARPLLLHDGLKGVSSPDIMANYINGTYVLDAVYDACQAGKAAGIYRLSEIAPDNFFEGDYYNSPEFHPCISMQTGSLAEEIVFLAPYGGGHLAYSLLRQRNANLFSAAEFERLQQVAPLVTSLIRKHWASLESQARRTDAGGEISKSFDTFAADRLTERERMIVSMILRGHSSLSAARSLDISEGTVKNHRKNIYAKLGISSQTELFNMFIRHLFEAR